MDNVLEKVEEGREGALDLAEVKITLVLIEQQTTARFLQIVNLCILGYVPNMLVNPGGAGGHALQAHHLPPLLQRHRVQRMPCLSLVQVGKEKER